MGLCCCRDRNHQISGDKVAVNHDAFLLMANSQHEMEDWVRAIRQVIWAPFGGGTPEACKNYSALLYRTFYVCCNRHRFL
ncbi:hypothetical protein GDO86_013032 [Hymenochirus boettgeri]|nr:hypothetical protein GDO86_013032 [Hymenochirus boettgeri]